METINFIKEKKKSSYINYPIEDNTEKFEKLPSNFYKTFDAKESPFGRTMIGYSPLKLKDKLINFSEGITKEIIDEVNNFLLPDTREKYKNLKIGHKLGIILHGKPGIGKTSAVHLVALEMIKKYNAIA